MSDLAELAWIAGVLGVWVAVYFAPSAVAFYRNVPNVWSVFVINLFLGWTLIGWVIALAMAVRSVPRQATV